MPVPTRTLTPVVLALASLVGCKEPADVRDEVEAYGVAHDGIVGEYCGCYPSFGYSSPDECYSAYGDFDSDVASCVVEVFDGREDVGESYLDCVVPAMEAYEECLLAEGCGDEGWHLGCLDERDAAFADCSPLPAELANGFAACLPGEPL